MPDPFSLPCPNARPALPLQGLTLLAVEDSRFACDALRLMCQRSGARLRRAETLQAAQAHLRVYRPDAVLVDLGLPDGRGDGLIRSLALSGAARPVVLGISGDPHGRATALAAGADGYLEKPLASLAAFQAAVMAHLPDRHLQAVAPPADARDFGPILPDPVALRDDMARAAGLIANRPDVSQRLYLAGFLGGLARSSCDADLAEAALQSRDPEGLARLARLLDQRIAESSLLQ